MILLLFPLQSFFQSGGGYGINVEPQPFYIKRLEEDRPDDINVQVGISDEEGSLKLYGDGTGATFDETSEETEKNVLTEVPVITLKQLIERYWNNEPIHFLKIDVEGWEKQCLSGMDFNLYRPWVICMESSEPGTDIPSYDKWEYILVNNKYKYLGSSGINRYYAAAECIDDLNDFKSGHELDEIYQIMSEGELQAATEALRLLRSKLLYPFRLTYRIFRRIKNRK